MRSACPPGLLICAMMLAGCGSTTVQEAPIPDLSVAVEKPGHCRIYLFRKQEPFCGVNTLQIHDQDVWIGGIGRKDQLCWERPAGLATIKMVMILKGTENRITTSTLECRPDEVVYWMVQMTGSPRRPEIRTLPAEEALPLLRDLQPAAPR